MLAFSETINHLSMTNTVHCHGSVLKRDEGYILRRSLE